MKITHHCSAIIRLKVENMLVRISTRSQPWCGWNLSWYLLHFPPEDMTECLRDGRFSYAKDKRFSSTSSWRHTVRWFCASERSWDTSIVCAYSTVGIHSSDSRCHIDCNRCRDQ